MPRTGLNVYRWRGHIVDKIGLLMKRYLSNAARRRLSFELTRDQFEAIVLSACIYCGDPPSSSVVQRHTVAYTGIDRRDSTSGYTWDNSASCCKVCNRMKMSMSDGDFVRHCLRVAERVRGSVNTLETT